jgi:hypothetical protein
MFNSNGNYAKIWRVTLNISLCKNKIASNYIINSKTMSSFFDDATQFTTTHKQLIGLFFIAFLAYYIIKMQFGYSDLPIGDLLNEQTSSIVPSWLKTIARLLLAFVFINGVLWYVFGIDLSVHLYDVFTDTAKLDINVDNNPDALIPSVLDASTVPRIRRKKQVFNIPENQYTYGDAKAMCTAYDARLATYKEVEDSYNSGGEWCNYGWSDGQLALFPTQQSTYDVLQGVEGHKNDCGRPGVNGGFIDNKNVRFGVNCFGYKPKMSSEERRLMDSATPYPQSAKDIAFQSRVDYWKTKISEILVSPFNYDSWGRV